MVRYKCNQLVQILKSITKEVVVPQISKAIFPLLVVLVSCVNNEREDSHNNSNDSSLNDKVYVPLESFYVDRKFINDSTICIYKKCLSRSINYLYFDNDKNFISNVHFTLPESEEELVDQKAINGKIYSVDDNFHYELFDELNDSIQVNYDNLESDETKIFLYEHMVQLSSFNDLNKQVLTESVHEKRIVGCSSLGTLK
jgi:DNA-directed RNA polymerase